FNAKSIDVKTSSGTVRGQQIQVLDKRLNTFIGIPYAEPPVGSLRFARPKPLTKPFPGIIDATKSKSSCMQGGTGQMSEDCLFINIWAPENMTQLKPVMFWIYGGGYGSGSIFSGANDAKALATDDVVVVSVNYRLRAFGFIYAGQDSDVPGNMGLYDQVLGLKWMRENIHLFGGNKDMITIFGESAGSWSVSALVLSPLTKGMFRRAILQSGADYHNLKGGGLVNTESALSASEKMAKHFNCTVDSNQEAVNRSNKWVDCLRKVDSKLINQYPYPGLFPLDGTEFLPLTAQEAIKQHKYNTDVDIIAGCNRNEGSNLAPKTSEKYTEQVFVKQVTNANHTFHELDINRIKEFYLNGVNTSDPEAVHWAFTEFYGDVFMKCPTYLLAKGFAEHSTAGRNVYFYELTYQSAGMSKHCQGVCHGAELEFVFGRPLVSSGPKIDQQLSREVMSYWINFVKTGIPTSADKWPKLLADPITPKIKDINPNNFKKILDNPFNRVCNEFWGKYFQ
ncbi:acetylcholinesterase-like, partial [Oppia nitens]|uniref:acetylcholinesterase-like n=1 Tax=Oppia nitens TaxID=1686743 RepID=UPI0023DBD200